MARSESENPHALSLILPSWCSCLQKEVKVESLQWLQCRVTKCQLSRHSQVHWSLCRWVKYGPRNPTFWTHVEGSSYRRLGFFNRRCQLRWHSKVSQFSLSLGVKEYLNFYYILNTYISRFQITMNYVSFCEKTRWNFMEITSNVDTWAPWWLRSPTLRSALPIMFYFHPQLSFQDPRHFHIRRTPWESHRVTTYKSMIPRDPNPWEHTQNNSLYARLCIA